MLDGGIWVVFGVSLSRQPCHALFQVPAVQKNPTPHPARWWVSNTMDETTVLWLLTWSILILTIAFYWAPTRERRDLNRNHNRRTRRKLAKRRILRELKEIRNDTIGITKRIQIILVKNHMDKEDITSFNRIVTFERGSILDGIVSDTYHDHTNDHPTRMMLTFKAIVDGPEGSPYHQGQFTIEIQIPDTYPVVPPQMKFVTKIWHPNISAEDGSIGIDILSTQHWSPTWTIQHVLLTLVSLLAKPEWCYVPTQNREALQMYFTNRTLYNATAQEWTEKYAEQKVVPLSQQIQMMDQLTEMGFQPRELVQSTLIRFDWNPTAAMEELLTLQDEVDGTKDPNAVNDDDAQDIGSTTNNNNNNNNSREWEIQDGMATLELLGDDGDDGMEATTTKLQEQQVADEEDSSG